MGTFRRTPPPDARDTFSLQDLADGTGIEPRTIRSYVERGLVAGPDSMGRGARYPRETFDRLRVLQLLRDANRDVTLDQLRVLLHSLSPTQLRAIADGTLRIGALIDTDAGKQGGGAPPAAADDANAKSSGATDALAYLRALKGAAKGTAKAPPPSDVVADSSGFTAPVRPEALHLAEPTAPYQRDPQPDFTDLSVLASAAQALAGLAGLASSSRSVRGEAWYRLALTPDIELSVRGDYGPEELAQLHRIGDALKILLTKGAPR